MLEVAMQGLTKLCSVLNDIAPICILNHVFVLKEYMRECILGNFRRRLLTVLKTDNDLQRPSVLELLLHRHISIVYHNLRLMLVGYRAANLTCIFTHLMGCLLHEFSISLSRGREISVSNSDDLCSICLDRGEP